jgi:adenosine deaminase
MLPPELTAFVEKMPKVNLHVHIEGAITQTTLLEIAQESDYFKELSVGQKEVLRRQEFTFNDFSNFIDVYSLCKHALRKPSDYERIIYEYLCRVHAENVRYVEIYISPYYGMKQGLVFEDIIQSASQARHRAYKELGIQADFVIDAGRRQLWGNDKDPERARRECERLVELAAKAREQGVIGFSIGGIEQGYPVYPFAKPFALARQKGLHTKAHAGESNGADDIWYVLGLLDVERIGNSVHAIEDQHLLDYLAIHAIAIELCPTGNIRTGAVSSLEAHPFMAFLKHGIPVAVIDDDPSLFNTSLTQEYMRLAAHYHLNADAVQDLVLQSVKMLWTSADKKSDLYTTFEKEFEHLRARLKI